MGIIKREGSEWVSSKGKWVNGCHQKGSEWMGIIKREVSEWVSSKGKWVNGYHQKGRKWMGIIKREFLNGYHQKGRKWMGIIKREVSEWVSSSGVDGYHQKWAWWGLTQFNYTYKLHWSILLQLRVNKAFRSFSVVFFWGSKYDVIDYWQYFLHHLLLLVGGSCSPLLCQLQKWLGLIRWEEEVLSLSLSLSQKHSSPPPPLSPFNKNHSINTTFCHLVSLS